MREGQREFYADAKEAAQNGKILLANAPTGSGKTAAALSAVLESSLQNNRRALFITNRSSHHMMAMEEIIRMNCNRKPAIASLKGGIGKIYAIDKIAKEKMCIYRLRNSRDFGMLRCEMGRSFCAYSRPSQAIVADVLEGGFDAAKANAYCMEKNACPHFASLGAMRGADIVIADYRYLFDEGVRNAFFQSSGFSLESADVIIDEAHNLPDAVREINSPSIDQDTCRLAAQGVAFAKKLAKKEGDAGKVASFSAPYSYIRETLSGFIDAMALAKKEGESSPLSVSEVAFFRKVHYGKSTLSGQGAKVSRSLHEDLIDAALYVRGCLAKGGADDDYSVEGIRKMEELASFLSVAANVAFGSPSAGLFARNIGEGNYLLKAELYDPAQITSEIFQKLHSAVLMSGTLIGKKSLIDLLHLQQSRIMRPDDSSYPSSFSKEKNPIAICSAATSRFSGRSDAANAKAMARIISDAARSCHPHSVAVFYPSYDYMESIRPNLALAEFSHEFEERHSSAKAQERKAKIERGASRGPLVFHGVIRGSFSEGVDFKKNPFKLIIIAGFPHPKNSGPHEAYEKYLSSKFKNPRTARLYASIYPALIRSAQALGRGIRGEDDMCYGVLIDDRFEAYKNLLPSSILQRAKLLRPGEIAQDVGLFAGKIPGERQNQV